MFRKAHSDLEHGVWPPPPEIEPVEDDLELVGLLKFLSKLSVFTAALSIGCVAYDFVISEICSDDSYYLLRRFMDDHILTSCYIQLLLVALSTACRARSRTVNVSRVDNAIRICAVIFACVGVLLIITILTQPREK